MNLRSLRERELISFLRREFGGPARGVVVGIGDDAAVLRQVRNRLLLTTDLLIEDVHFTTDRHPPVLLGRKALNVNLSDIAAMGGQPLFALLGLGLRSGITERWVEEFSSGLKQAAREAGVTVVGGDVSAARKICLAVTVVGEGEKAVLRSGAKHGDGIFVSGYLGDAAAGLRLLQRGYEPRKRRSFDPLFRAFLDPRPQIALGRMLARRNLASAMIDTSDGLSVDLYHLCQESGVGAVIELEALPISASLRRLGEDPIDFALHGGEDYQLLFTVPPAKESEVIKLGRKFFLSRIGRITREKTICVVDARGRKRLLPTRGYEHLAP